MAVPLIASHRAATRYTYDASGSQLSVTDPVGNTTTYAYDALNRLTSDTNELGEPRLYEYDAAGNAISVTDRNGWERVMVYDALSRLWTEDWMDGLYSNRTIIYSYDAAGRVLSIGDGGEHDLEYAYVYDDLGRLLSSSETGSLSYDTIPLTDVLLESGDYDAAGRRGELTVSLNSVADFTNSYGYDDQVLADDLHSLPAAATAARDTPAGRRCRPFPRASTGRSAKAPRKT